MSPIRTGQNISGWGPGGQSHEKVEDDRHLHMSIFPLYMSIFEFLFCSTTMTLFSHLSHKSITISCLYFSINILPNTQHDSDLTFLLCKDAGYVRVDGINESRQDELLINVLRVGGRGGGNYICSEHSLHLWVVHSLFPLFPVYFPWYIFFSHSLFMFLFYCPWSFMLPSFHLFSSVLWLSW